MNTPWKWDGVNNNHRNIKGRSFDKEVLFPVFFSWIARILQNPSNQDLEVRISMTFIWAMIFSLEPWQQRFQIWLGSCSVKSPHEMQNKEQGSGFILCWAKANKSKLVLYHSRTISRYPFNAHSKVKSISKEFFTQGLLCFMAALNQQNLKGYFCFHGL